MNREPLPDRRPCITQSFKMGRIRYHGSVGYYPDENGDPDFSRPAEIFLNGAKSGSDTRIAMQDSAVAVSFALQHGASIDTIRRAMCRREDGTPEGPLGQFLDMLVNEAAPATTDKTEGA